MTQIERRQSRLREVQEKHGIYHEEVPQSPEEHHHIGAAESVYEYLGPFLRQRAGDPAVKVCPQDRVQFYRLNLTEQDFYRKLTEHLLERLLPDAHAPAIPSGTDSVTHHDRTVVLQHDRFYTHALMRINYTTYDVRRTQDVISRNANRDNIMVLADRAGQAPQSHPYAYARVLGIYHANAFVVGGDATDFRPRRIEFLWVRWYRLWEPELDALQSRRLDQVSFPPVTDPDAFGFLDPADVVRSCYIVPAFSSGQQHSDGKGLSYSAQDGMDWKRYYIQRYAPSPHRCIESSYVRSIASLTATW